MRERLPPRHGGGAAESSSATTATVRIPGRFATVISSRCGAGSSTVSGHSFAVRGQLFERRP
jgi:hypothetical protein